MIAKTKHRQAMKDEARIRARIRQLRRERDMTLDDLAKATGIDKSSLSQRETGRRKITLRDLLIIARALHVDLKEILRDGSSPKSKTIP